MRHPFEILKPEYTQLLALMVVRPECRDRVDQVAQKILASRAKFDEVTEINGVPLVFMGPSFYREASLDFNLSPAQGDSWRKVSTHVPKGRGPFRNWPAAAVDAYHLNGLDGIGAKNWTWELICYYGEIFNGMGYRDFHHMHSPYLWGGTNIQTAGKYTSDGLFDHEEMDTQLGIIPIARHIVEIEPSYAPSSSPVVIPTPIHSTIAQDEGDGVDTAWVQTALNGLGWDPPLVTDGNYGRKTAMAVSNFQRMYGLDVDAICGPKTIAAIKEAIAVQNQTEAV